MSRLTTPTNYAISLAFYQASIRASGRKQFFVGAALDGLPVFQDQDKVGIAQGAEAVGEQMSLATSGGMQPTAHDQSSIIPDHS